MIYLKVQIFEWLEQRAVKKHFYGNKQFKKLDQALLAAYQGKNPYHISKSYLQKQGASNIYAYGETPLTTVGKIVEECGIGPEDTVIEMGAGRGRASLFLAVYVGCTVIAYERIPTFVERMVDVDGLEMLAENMFSADFSEATVIFLYGTMLSDEEILQLCEKFPKRAKILTVSYPLSDYSEEYRIEKTLSGRFPWGETEVYWNERIG
ncbi:MAG: hypothetical protein K1000chlam2_00137 [Chlamydiae bacterium]|nr:hypothetical protein [Chlamydiota bacterium]